MKFSGSVVLCLFGFLAWSQNLVPNPEFEAFLKCPVDFLKPGEFFSLPGWYSPNSGTPDYFNSCSEADCSASTNWAGICRDHYGNGYAGIIAYMATLNYREYLACELIKPLDSGITYSLQFSFRLSSYSKISSGNLGLAFGQDRFSASHDKVIPMIPKLIAMRDSAIVIQTGNWQTARGEYVARGGERHLIIGNFFSQEKNPIYKILYGGDNEPMLSTASYFYIDNVSVRTSVEYVPPQPIAYEGEDLFEKDSLITLRHVQFDYNSAKLNNDTDEELKKLLKFLKTHSGTHIEILGHTDDQGNNEYNQRLSLSRAKAVVQYLIDEGIKSNRMTSFGYGKSTPLIKSADENARKINRRVEVRLVR